MSRGPISVSSYRAALAVYFLVISFLSHIPGESLQQIDLDVSDKLLHVILYMPLGFFLWAGLSGKGPGAALLPKILFFVAIAAALGGLDEFHQSFVPGRFASVFDTIADVAGCVLGAGVRLFPLCRSRR